MKRIILQIDGGGIRGICPAVICAAIEKELREKCPKQCKRLRDVLSLVSGTSTGSIIAGMVFAGVDAAKISRFYLDDGVRLFNTTRNWTYPFNPKYKRGPFIETIKTVLKDESLAQDPDCTLGHPKFQQDGPVYMSTAFNLMSGRTHFTKSDDPDDKGFLLRDVMAWSGLSAANYFGKIPVPPLPPNPPIPPRYKWDFVTFDPRFENKSRTQAVLQDGGQGTQNCTLGFVLIETLTRQWFKDGVVIMSLGTGSKKPDVPYKDVARDSMLEQVWKFIWQARAEAESLQILAVKHVMKADPISNPQGNRAHRLDWDSEKDYGLDDTSNWNLYKDMAEMLIASPAFKDAVKDIVAEVSGRPAKY